jgi:hypothetical protein
MTRPEWITLHVVSDSFSTACFTGQEIDVRPSHILSISADPTRSAYVTGRTLVTLNEPTDSFTDNDSAAVHSMRNLWVLESLEQIRELMGPTTRSFLPRDTVFNADQ